MHAFLRDEYTEIAYSTEMKDGHFPLRSFILESGLMGARSEMHFLHPKPNFNRLFFMLSGRGHAFINGRHRTLVGGSCYLLPIYKTIDLTYEAGCKFLYFHVSVQDITGLDIFRDISSVQRLRTCREAFQEIITTYPQDGLRAKLRWQSALFHVICHFCTPAMLASWESMHDSRRYHSLLRYIQERCRASLSVRELAAYVHVSQSALSKGFRRQIGFPLKQYLLNLLMQKARKLLTDTDDSIQQIALSLGYEDPYYFFRVFKKFMQETPMQYRKASQRSKQEVTV